MFNNRKSIKKTPKIKQHHKENGCPTTKHLRKQTPLYTMCKANLVFDSLDIL